MAVTRSKNVIKITADNDTVVGILRVSGIKYIAGTTSPTAQIKETDTNGFIYWETASASTLYEQVDIRLSGTTHFDLAGTGTILELYLE